jgi:pseudaminic acid cytidylyltransferase
MNVAILPARGGSKRIPKKNISLFEGKPLISYSITAAKRSGVFDRIIVSTDSDEIAETAKKFGAEVPFVRPGELSDDHTATVPVVLHALDWLIENRYDVRALCCIYPTAPFIRAEDLKRGYRMLCEKSAASAFSVTTFAYPIFRALKINQNGRVRMIQPEYMNARSQDLPEAYHDAGQFYWADPARLQETISFMSEDALPVIIPRYLVQDIDTQEDWITAEHMFRSLRQKGLLDRLDSAE